jgi:hypothetical protein
MLDRRRFLIGLGGLLTTAFVGEARSFARRTGGPLILPTRKSEETLYIYDQSDWSDDGKWRVSLGPDVDEAPAPPTWRKHLLEKGYRLESEADLSRIVDEMGLTSDELNTHVDEFGWQDEWDNFLSPQAKAHQFLKQLDLGTDPDSKLKKAGQMNFEDMGGGPGNSYHWVDLKDDLTVSLLQARLIELELPIRIEIGEPI